jgi:hypothetical protein
VCVCVCVCARARERALVCVYTHTQIREDFCTFSHGLKVHPAHDVPNVSDVGVVVDESSASQHSLVPPYSYLVSREL